MSMNRSHPNTKLNEVRENIFSEYAEELKLNIRCDEDDSHVAVLYCPNCLASLCRTCSGRLHSSKVLSKHEVVRLTQKPEPPIYCHLHPLETAKLVCKEPSCKGINKPMCTMCHQYETHKDHKYTLLENEYNRIRTNIANCLEEIETKRTNCDKNVDEYDKCISSYSSTNPGFWKTERDEIYKFYTDARTLALKTFDDFANNQIDTLKLLQNQYISDKTKLDNMSSELRNIEEMKKLEVIKNGNNVEKMIIQAAKNIDNPTYLIPSKSCNITYPDIAMMNLKIEIPIGDQHKIHAVYIKNIRYCSPSALIKSRKVSAVENKNYGILYKYRDGRSILNLNQWSNDTIDLSQYKYIFVIDCWPEIEEEVKDDINEQMKNNLWIRIVVLIDGYDWINGNDFRNGIQEIARSDKRVEVLIDQNRQKILDNIRRARFEKSAMLV